MFSSSSHKETFIAVDQTSPGLKIKVAEVPPKAKQQLRRHMVGPQEGFGPLWYKSFALHLKPTELSPAQLIQEWKANFSKFWPNGNYFYEPLSGLNKGDVALVQSEVVGGVTLSTGLVVVQSNPQSFTLLTTKGHIFNGKITFLARQSANAMVVEVRLLARSADPLVELAMLMVGHRLEDQFWKTTLTNLARYLKIGGTIRNKAVCVNPDIHWQRVSNVLYNPLWRSAIELVEDPFSLLGRTRR